MALPRTIILGTLALTGAGLLTHGLAAPQMADVKPVAAPQFVSYKFGAAQWLSAPRSVQMSQGVTFGQDDSTLRTDSAVALLDKDQHLLSATSAGPVHIFNPQDDLTGLHGSVDFTRHLARLQDDVVLVVKPGPKDSGAAEASPRRQFKDPATLTCQAMTYDYRRKIGRVPGPLTVRQVIQTKDGPETRTLTADAGLYNGQAQTIQLVGTIHGEYSDGSIISGDTRIKGQPVVIGIKEGSEYIDVPFPTQGHFTLKNNSTDTVEDNSDDVDLTLPTPAAVPKSFTAPPVPPRSAPPKAASPAASPAPAAPTQTPPSQTAPPPAGGTGKTP